MLMMMAPMFFFLSLAATADTSCSHPQLLETRNTCHALRNTLRDDLLHAASVAAMPVLTLCFKLI